MQKHRISTDIGKDQFIKVDLKQEFDLLEILSLKFTQKEAYASYCSDYGVVCGRISVNNGFGVPNARVSIFIPLNDSDVEDPVISTLYPYKSVTERNDDNYRYNLLPSRKQHGGHEPTGTFPDQSDILNRDEMLEIYEKYYKFTVKTNDSGDFMIWGVPLGSQTLHVDVDLSDIGCLSLRPYDFIRQGIGVEKFKNQYSFKSSTDIDSLPQIISFDKTIEVYPLWGNESICEIGITRTDFDLSSNGVTIEPKAFILGSIFSDSEKNTINKNCTPKKEMGEKCGLTTASATIEAIRFTPYKDENNRPIIESYSINEDVDDDGSFVLPVPMNMDYVYTNEFGESEITNDKNKGIPTSASYRFRISIKNEQLGRRRGTASYLLPNIREYNTNETEIDKSYSFSLDWNDYPSGATTNNMIFNSVDGYYYPQDYFYRFTYNKVYAVSSFMGSYFTSNGGGRETYLGLKELSPKTEDDCDQNVVNPPINFATKNRSSFSTLLMQMLNFMERILYYIIVAIIQIIILPFQILWSFKIGWPINWRPFGFFDKLVIEPLQIFGTLRLGITLYPECETCDNLDVTNTDPNDSPFKTVISGVSFPDNYITCFTDNDTSVTRVYLQTPTGPCYTYPSFFDGATLNSLLNDYNHRYKIRVNDITNQLNDSNITLVKGSISGQDVYYFDDNDRITWINETTPPSSPITYIIMDTTQQNTSGNSTSTLNSEVTGTCQQYVTVYDESIVKGTYCVDNPNIQYSELTSNDIIYGGTTTCPSGKFVVGQVIVNDETKNPCSNGSTKSGFSEFRYGLFTIIPAASIVNWKRNFDAITEYSKRKLVGNMFCGGVVNYSFIDNWLSGSLYFFPFKSKIRWDHEDTLDLNVKRSKYCKELLYFKIKETDTEESVKRFYYRSTKSNGISFINDGLTLGHPTTFVDLGPRDEFINEICIDESMDVNSSVSRNIGPTSYQEHKDMLGLYINYKLDTGGNLDSFFDNKGFDSRVPPKLEGNILNGEIIQLISINNEAGIEGFDLDNRNYGAYSPQYLDPDNNPDLFTGAFPVTLVLEDIDGYRVRSSINEPGRLTESSQNVPFYLWNKQGTGFGTGVNQSWDYGIIQSDKLQGMTYGYNFTGNPTHKYVLFPMTKNYGGKTFEFDVLLDDINADIETTTLSLSTYNLKEEGFTVLHIINGTIDNPISGSLYTRVGDTGNWVSKPWTNNVDYVLKPTVINYNGNKQILSTPFLFYFGLRPGKTAIDKFIKLFGPKGAFPSVD